MLDLSECTYHDGFPLILNDMTRSADFITSTEAEEHELISGIDGLFWSFCRHGSSLSFRCHGCS